MSTITKDNINDYVNYFSYFLEYAHYGEDPYDYVFRDYIDKEDWLGLYKTLKDLNLNFYYLTFINTLDELHIDDIYFSKEDLDTFLSNGFLYYFFLQLDNFDILQVIHKLDENDFANVQIYDELVLPDNIKEINEGCFFYNERIKKVVLPKSLKQLEKYVFYCCEELEEVVLPDSLLEIKSEAFQSCVSLKNINLPENLYYIGSYAFDECHSINNVKLPKSIKKIERYAFGYCFNLTDLFYDGTINEFKQIDIDKDAFDNANITIHCLDGNVQ